MKLTILGSGYFIPTANRNNSGYLLAIGGESILLDSGSGILRQLIKSGHTVWDINRIFYSHMHLDHIADLLPILFTRKYSQPETNSNESLSIYGHADFENVLTAYETLFGNWISNEKYPYIFNHLTPGDYTFNEFTLTVYEGNHADQSLMYCFKDKSGKSLLYASDTGFSEELVAAVQGITALLIECTSSNAKRVAGHMTPNDISKLLQRCRPELTILTHISPDTDRVALAAEISAPQECQIVIAEDFMSYRI